jgi:DNA-nicking Smr family endonuclease
VIGGRDDDEDRAAFERAMAGVKPIRAGKERAVVPKPRPAPTRRAPVAAKRAALLADGDDGSFRGSDIPREVLHDLRRGALELAREIDLHGLAARLAAQTVARAVESAFEDGIRGLRIVHGRGRHSPAGPVLRDVVRDTLCQAPLVGRVAAIAPAPSRMGGAGATLVWLRRRRNASKA